MTFGEKLRLIRKYKRMSQQDLAYLLGTSKQVISRYELGQTTPKIGVAAEWCEKLGISLDSMLNDDYDGIEFNRYTRLGEYRTLPKEEPTADPDQNTVILAARGGGIIKRKLTNEQIELLEKLIQQMPETDEDL